MGGVADQLDVETPPPADPVSAAAFARHARRMRPLRMIYAAVLVVLAVVVVTIVVVAYQRGEISHASLKTVAVAPPKIGLQPASTPLTRAWTTSDTTAIGLPYFDGTVITHDQHTVRGRDARTGAQTWSYTRTDRAVCAAIQTQGVTVAVYRLHGNCDQLTALDSDTGQRKWTRTLDKDGAEFNGPASYSVLPGNIMFVSATSIYAVATSGDADDGNGGLDYWTFHHPGCTIHGAVLGAGGALISQTCVHENCGDTRFCGNGTQLLLRDATKGYDDDSKTNKRNPDQIIWNKIGSDLVPTAAGQQIAARDPAGGSLQLLDAKNGRAGARLPLTGRSDSAAPTAFASASDADLIWVGGRSYALRTGATEFAWQRPTTSVPTVTDPAGNSTPPLASARLAIPTTSGLAELDGATGQLNQQFAVGGPAAGSLAYPFGTGFVVAGPDTTLYR
jgi:outer membrane protein assembly factor BamB